MTDPTPNLEPPTIPTATCGRCGAKSAKTDDYYQCGDCCRLVCPACQVDDWPRFHAELCCDCADAREPQDGEVEEAFLYERGQLVGFLSDYENYTRWCELTAALTPLVRQIELSDPDVLTDNDRRAIEDTIRRMPVRERPWREEGAKA
jgi:hypothetical protein